MAKITDAQIEAACDAHHASLKDGDANKTAMRAALEAAAQAASAPQPRETLLLENLQLLKEIRQLKEAAAQAAPAPTGTRHRTIKAPPIVIEGEDYAAPAPTAAPGEYDALCEALLTGDPVMRKASAVIRKLTAEKRAWQEHANWMEECRDAAEARAAALEAAAQAATAQGEPLPKGPWQAEEVDHDLERPDTHGPGQAHHIHKRP